MLKRKPITAAMGLAVGLASLGFGWGNAVYAEDTMIEEIVVTGSIIKRAETSSASPVSVLTKEELNLRGINTVADAVTQLPANNAGTMNASWSTFGFSTGASAVSLRGLTTSSTLTTFDGMRMAPYPLGDDGRRNFVDLGTIPDSITQRIEVLKDGASSTYGADAIAGVVNVITKKEITGLHLNGTMGQSGEGDGDEWRGDVTWGFGELSEDGYNFYVNVERQGSDSIAAKERSKFGSWDWTDRCNGQGGCLDNGHPLGRQADGSIFGATDSMQPLVRPVNADGTTGNYQLIDPAGGCTAMPFLIEHTPTNGAAVGITGPVCENAYFGDFVNIYPKIERTGLNLHFTKTLGDNTEFYAMVNYYNVETSESGGTPYIFGGTTPPGDADTVRVSISGLTLPTHVCPIGANGYVTCDASNGTLNPNNPFAANGQTAQIRYRMPFPRQSETDTESYRYSAGLTGSFGDANSPWDYTVDLVISKVEMDLKRSGYPIPRRILDVVYDGSFNFVNPELNSAATWNYIAPSVTTYNESTMDQIQATLAKEVYDLKGGALIVAGGLAYREESVNAPSANPNQNDPYQRYLSVNTVAAKGKRDVKSAFFEIDAPILDNLSVNISGRYDDYSTGQDDFSPKIGVMYTPIDMITLRATYSEGFRIPSFNEAFGAPTTGYITVNLDENDPAQAAFIAAHGNNAYVNGGYSLGLTATGNAALEPEESESFTFGIILEPDWDIADVSLTIDYWDIDVSNLISNLDYSPAIAAYYNGNGTVNLPGITVIPDAIDIENPAALPRLGFIQYSYENADNETATGIDIGANVTFEIGEVLFRSHLELSHLLELSKTIGGTTFDFEGTLSPCDVTSCSGAPDWRATWVNSAEWRDFTFALTMNYTGDYSNASADYGGDENDCAASLHASVYTYDDGTAFKCDHDSYMDFDFSATYRINEKMEIFANILNVFDEEPEFDPASAYALYGFNPAWELNGWRGRYFKLGARMEF